MDNVVIAITFAGTFTGGQYVLTECKEISDYLNKGYRIDEMKSAGTSILVILYKTEDND